MIFSPSIHLLLTPISEGRFHALCRIAEFAKGFSHTKHDTISFKDVKDLPNNNIQIEITFQAIEDFPTGERVNNYYMLYTLAPNQRTKFLSRLVLFELEDEGMRSFLPGFDTAIAKL